MEFIKDGYLFNASSNSTIEKRKRIQTDRFCDKDMIPMQTNRNSRTVTDLSINDPNRAKKIRTNHVTKENKVSISEKYPTTFAEYKLNSQKGQNYPGKKNAITVDNSSNIATIISTQNNEQSHIQPISLENNLKIHVNKDATIDVNKDATNLIKTNIATKMFFGNKIQIEMNQNETTTSSNFNICQSNNLVPLLKKINSIHNNEHLQIQPIILKNNFETDIDKDTTNSFKTNIATKNFLENKIQIELNQFETITSSKLNICQSDSLVPLLKKSLWELNVQEYNEKKNNLFNKLNIENYNIQLTEKDIDLISLYFKTTPLNIGYDIEKNQKQRFIDSLPIILKNDYQKFQQQYTIIDYRFFNNILKTLHGTIHNNDYNTRNHLPLYFNFKNKNLQNDSIILSDVNLIDITLSYNKLINMNADEISNYNINDPYIIVTDNINNIYYLPLYEDFDIPRKIWTYLHLMRIFILKNFNESLKNSYYIFCPIKILCCIYKYSKMVTYIANNCKKLIHQQ